jgi:hypothetical protein
MACAGHSLWSSASCRFPTGACGPKIGVLADLRSKYSRRSSVSSPAHWAKKRPPEGWSNTNSRSRTLPLVIGILPNPDGRLRKIGVLADLRSKYSRRSSVSSPAHWAKNRPPEGWSNTDSRSRTLPLGHGPEYSLPIAGAGHSLWSSASCRIPTGACGPKSASLPIGVLADLRSKYSRRSSVSSPAHWAKKRPPEGWSNTNSRSRTLPLVIGILPNPDGRLRT